MDLPTKNRLNMEKQKKQMRYTEIELNTIKEVFSENEELLKTIRKIMLQMPLNAVDLAELEFIRKPNILNVLRKTFLPTLDPDAPLNQIVDLWMTVQLADKEPLDALYQLRARELLINYINQQLKVLEDKSKEKIKFGKLINLKKPNAEAGEIYFKMVARNSIIQHIEMQLNMLHILAGLKEETLEQTQERLRKDSSK